MTPLAARFSLPDAAVAPLARYARLLMTDPRAPTAVRERARVLDDHLADSLVALDLTEVRDAPNLADLGSGAGVPGLPLACARPAIPVTLIESSAKSCAFLRRAAAACAAANVTVEQARAEEAAAAGPRFALVTARALASLAVVAEYAAPLLTVGGALVVWRGQRDAAAEAQGDRAADVLGLSPAVVHHVRPYPAAESRHLHVFVKRAPTPERYPRRAGVAVKRPLGR